MTAVSADSEERATRVKSGQILPQRRFAYEFRPASAREWSLSFSAGGGDRSPEREEQSLLAEPALFLVRPSGMICFSSGANHSLRETNLLRYHRPNRLRACQSYPARGRSRF